MIPLSSYLERDVLLGLYDRECFARNAQWEEAVASATGRSMQENAAEADIFTRIFCIDPNYTAALITSIKELDLKATKPLVRIRLAGNLAFINAVLPNPEIVEQYEYLITSLQ